MHCYGLVLMIILSMSLISEGFARQAVQPFRSVVEPEVDHANPSTEDNLSRALGPAITDQALAALLRQALAADEVLNPFYVVPEVIHGHVTLYGQVSTVRQSLRADAVVRRLTGTYEVENAIVLADPGASYMVLKKAGSNARRAYHVVRSGESLYDIAQHYGLTIHIIKYLNHLTSNQLRIGQRLRVRHVRTPAQSLLPPKVAVADALQSEPVDTGSILPDPEPPLAMGRHHVVEKGETLWRISRRYGITIERIQQLNQLESNTIEIGQVLMLPETL